MTSVADSLTSIKATGREGESLQAGENINDFNRVESSAL